MTVAMAGVGRSARSQTTDEFEQALKDFATIAKDKPKIAGGGNTWQLAVVRTRQQGRRAARPRERRDGHVQSPRT